MTYDIRLKKEKDFNQIFKSGKKFYSNKLMLYYLPASQLKVGFAVGKKFGSSVKRNRIKRILRESFRSFTPFLRQNFFFVFIPKISEEYNLNEIKENMDFIFRKGNFYLEEC